MKRLVNKVALVVNAFPSGYDFGVKKLLNLTLFFFLLKMKEAISGTTGLILGLFVLILKLWKILIFIILGEK